MPELLSRDAILAAEDIPTEHLAVPEWGGSVRIKMLTGTQRDAWEARFAGAETHPNIRASLAALTVVDAKGKRLFADKDVAALGAKSASALDRIFEAACRLNCLRDSDIQDLAGNSAGGQDVSGPSV